ncbi:hypothetical protein UR09_01660 [Candidatus Nitromaritima sp. SCGC AAA799-A02]|nr:hypothetical protein UR09_01660 [Candidatus Nitromaritima sp. SCGC AAA799-A02]
MTFDSFFIDAIYEFYAVDNVGELPKSPQFSPTFLALKPSLKTIASIVARLTQPRVFFVLSRTVEKVDSIGLVVLT